VFTSSHPLVVFEYFRVPCTVDPSLASDGAVGAHLAVVDGWAGGWGRLSPAEPAEPAEPPAELSAPARPSLLWPRQAETVRGAAETAAGGRAMAPRRFRLGTSVLHARLVPDDLLATALPHLAGGWIRADPLCDDGGARLGSVWRATDGSLLLPFDPDEVVTSFWSEHYTDTGAEGAAGRLRRTVMSVYYGVRPLMPRRLQIAARRLYSRVQARQDFPRWPLEASLHDFYDQVLAWACELAGRPVPWLAPWPAGRSWALVLTHDVETADGVRLLPALRSIEERTGNRSSWNLVPGRYRVDDAFVGELQAAGFEVGLHGLHHDGRDLEPGELQRRLPEMRRWAQRWGAVGFRSPATHRDWDTMAALPFRYDSSSPDTDPYEPQPGGCCSLLPFHNRSLIELPITLPQDHTLFVILKARDGQAWLDKTDRIRERGGMALIITHPDYVVQAPIEAAYEQLLRHVADDGTVWRALPAEVAAWWDRRAASSIVPDGPGWTVVGPAAAEAVLCWTAADAGGARLPRVLPATDAD
jgi:peptidoglycan/xylan/chitin deacetylase (PgdA/CDA1 family)